MEVVSPEITITVGTTPYSASEADILAQVMDDEFDPGNLEELIHQAIDQAEAEIRKRGRCRNIELDLRFWTREDVRPSLHLSARIIERLASLSSSFSFHPKSIPAPNGEVGQLDARSMVGSQSRPELVVKLRGRPQGRERFVDLSRLESHWYTPLGLQARVSEALISGINAIPEDVGRWDLYVDIDLFSERGIWPGFFLPDHLIKDLASHGASLDFDPYVYSD